MEARKITRDSNGLDSSVNYVFDADGFVDWRKMVKPEFLVVNKRLFEKSDMPIPEGIDGLADSQLLILLAGIKKLARLRGYTCVEYVIQAASENFVTATCKITWIPNFETEFREIVFSSAADAHLGNTDGFGKNFLTAIAENRAFVRCVRNFLGINIVGQDEVCSKVVEETETQAPPTNIVMLLEKLMNEKKVSFEVLKAKLIEEKFDGAESISSISDIPKVKIFELVGRLKNKKG